MQVVVIVGDVICYGGDLRLGAGMGRQLQIMGDGNEAGQCPWRWRCWAIARDGRDRTVMFGDPLKSFPRQVQPVEFRVMAFKMGHDADRLRVVVEPAMGRHQRLQRILAGMAERRVAQIMGERHSFRQVLVEPQRTRDGARHLRHLDRMGQPGAEIIAFMFHEDLRLVLEPPKGRGMDDPVTVALKGRAKGAFVLRHAAAAGLGRVAGKRRAHHIGSASCRS